MNHHQKRSRSRLAMFNLRRMADRKSDRSPHFLTAAVRPCAESLERRMLLSVSASMVADINVSTADSTPCLLGDLGNGKAVMYADDGFHGYEPFVTDGTAAGTTLLKDIYPGPTSSLQPGSITTSYSANPVVANGRLFFNANDSVHGNELWITDGTPAGTTLLKDINPGSASSSPSAMVAIGNTVLFVANDGTDGWQLWKSDGTPDGTLMVTTIGTLPNGPSALERVFNGRLFFTAYDSVHGYELWSTDGTAAGTTMFMDINPGQASSNPSWLTVCGSQLFFIANDGTDGSALWVTDGTSAGTHIVSNIVGGSMTNVNGTLYFEDTVGSISNLYKSDGTSAGTVLVYSFNNSYAINNMAGYGNDDYFVANDGVSGYELWQSDGTTAGTTQVADLAPGAASAFSISYSNELVVAGSKLFFSADPGGGAQLYVISSVGGAPTPITPAGSIQGNSSDRQLWVNGSGLYFTGFSPSAGVELWHSDGTAAGTAMVADINQTTISSNSSPLAEINGHGVFAADDSIHGMELWVTDGSAGGTTLLKDIVPGPADGLPSFSPVPLGNYYYFVAGAGNGQIWRTDGTANGTTLCLSYLPASTTTSYAGISQLACVNGSLYFFADDGTGSALYTSDGTPSGTTRLQYLSPSTSNGNQVTSLQYSVVGNEVIFAAADSAHGTEPWVTDGTPAGTMLLKDINAGTASSLVYFQGLQSFVTLGSAAYFIAKSQAGLAIWKTDGTSAGTTIVEDFSTNANISSVDDLTPFNGKLYFTANNLSTGGAQLWTSDGTSGGTQSIGAFSVITNNLTVVGNTLFFSVITPASSGDVPELYASDGTAAGTVLVPGLAPGGLFGGQLFDLTNVRGTLYFSAPQEDGSSEICRVDQSPQTGMSIEEIWPPLPAAFKTSPSNLAALDGTLFFKAADQTHGAEVWKLNLLHADAGGPYLATGAIQLNASASRDPNPNYPLTYSWDLNGNGIFGETGETGINPSYSANQFYPGVYPVTVQVTGSWQNTAAATSYVSVPPRPQFAGDSLTFTLGSAAANVSIQSWNIDWGDGTPVENYAGSTTSVSHIFATASGANPFMVQVSAVVASGTIEPLPMPVTVYPAPVLNNGSLYLTGTSGSDQVAAFNTGEFYLNFNGAIRQYNISLISHFFYSDGGGDDQIGLRDSLLATLNLSTGNDSIANIGATVIVNPGTGKLQLQSSGTTTFAASNGTGIRQLQFSSIYISNSGKLFFADTNSTLGDYANHANRTLVTVDAGGLDISSGGTLDMGDNDLILHYAAGAQASADSQVFNLLQSGITPNGDWSGTGITSSEANYDSNFGIGARALGWIDNNDVQDSSFDGVTLSDFNQVIIKFTYYGDVDLSGTFDATDVNQLIAGRSHTPGNTGWEFDDLDYDGVTSSSTDQNLFFTGRSAYQKFGAL